MYTTNNFDLISLLGFNLLEEIYHPSPLYSLSAVSSFIIILTITTHSTVYVVALFFQNKEFLVVAGLCLSNPYLGLFFKVWDPNLLDPFSQEDKEKFVVIASGCRCQYLYL